MEHPNTAWTDPMPRGARIAGWVYFPIHAVVLPLTLLSALVVPSLTALLSGRATGVSSTIWTVSVPLLVMPPLQFSEQLVTPSPFPDTVTWVSPSPKKSRVTCWVAPNTTLPLFAVIVPEFSM